MIDAELIARAHDADLLATAESLGARLKRSGANEWEGPCPLCGGRNRFSVNTRKRTWHCRGCARGDGDAISLVRHMLGVGLREAVAFLVGEDVSQKTAPPVAKIVAPSESDEIALKRARAIVAGIGPLRGSPGEAYLRDERKIDVGAIADVLERTDAIGWHSSVYFREDGHSLDRRRLGAIIAIMSDPVTAKSTGAISRTYLHDGKKIGKAKTLGRPASIVRLDRDEDVLGGLHLAEGLETALAAMSKGLRPMWAAGSTALMAKFPVLGGVECLTLIVDHDQNRAGEEAAREAERRWRPAGREVRLLRSDDYGDFNDAVAREAK